MSQNIFSVENFFVSFCFDAYLFCGLISNEVIKMPWLIIWSFKKLGLLIKFSRFRQQLYLNNVLSFLKSLFRFNSKQICSFETL